MKKISKYFSLAVAAVMTLCLFSFGVTFTASADYSIKLNKPTNQSMVGHTYTAYKVFAATINATQDAYTYTLSDSTKTLGTIDADYTDTTATPNVAYTPTTIANEATARAFAEFLNTKYFTEGTAGYTRAHDTALVDQGYVSPAAADDTAGFATVTVPSEGYYAIVDTYAGDNSGTVISLVMLNTAQTTPNVVNIKADAVASLDSKQVRIGTENFSVYTDAETGSTVDFLLTAKIPNIDVANYDTYNYKVEDVMDSCFVYDNTSLAVYSDAALTTAIASVATGTLSGNTLTISFGDIKNKVAADAAGVTAEKPFYRGETIYIKYSAKFSGANAKYYSNVNSPNVNAAKLKYSNDPNANTEFSQSTATQARVWTFGFEFTKVIRSADATLAVLPGAVFNVKKGDNTLYFKQTADGSGIYYVCNSTDDGATTSLSCNATTAKLAVYGLDQSVDYTLVEVTAPDGYSLGANTTFRVQPTYNADGTSITAANWSITGNNVVDTTATGNDRFGDPKTINANAAQIWNASGSMLVGTGGIGTTIFYIAGGILMAGALILLITKLRMKNKD